VEELVIQSFRVQMFFAKIYSGADLTPPNRG